MAGIRWEWKQPEGPRQDVSPDVQRARVAELAAILHGVPWILGGGLAIPFTLGEFHRLHDDIDLLFDDADFPAIEAAFARAGYQLWQHYTMSFFGAWRGAWHVPVRSDGLLPRLRRRKLKFRDARGRPPDALLTVDALPFRILNGMLVTCDGRHRYPLTRPMVGHVAHTPQRFPIPCLALEYVALLKGTRRNPKDLHDFAIIRDFGRLPAGDWGV